MKDARDPGTIDMTLAPKRGRGRPSTGKAKSAAERMRDYRSRSVTVNRDVLESAVRDYNSDVLLRVEQGRVDFLEEENARLSHRVEELEAQLRLHRAISGY